MINETWKELTMSDEVNGDRNAYHNAKQRSYTLYSTEYDDDYSDDVNAKLKSNQIELPFAENRSYTW